VNLTAPVSFSSFLAKVDFPEPINPMTICAKDFYFPA
jgi:hypothetical protein